MLREQNLYIYRAGYGASSEKQALSNFLDTLRKSEIPATQLNLAAMYARSDQFEILHPVFTVHALRFRLPNSICSPNELSQNAPVNRQCDSAATEAPDVDLLATTKQRAFYRIILNEQLPTEQFLLDPPFADESGTTYAYQFWKMGLEPFSTETWIRAHLSFYKPNELKEIFTHLNIKNPAFEIIAQLTESEIKAMVEAAPVVLTNHFLLLKNEDRLGFSPLSYFVYDLGAVRSKLKGQEYDLLPSSPGLFCAERIGNACWTYNAKATMAYIYRYALGVLLFAVFILTVLVALYINYAVDKNKRQKSIRTSLQVLSHEFRTPVSSMLLLLDELARGSHKLSDHDQDLITKLGSETFRLQRIVEMSRSYLEVHTEQQRRDITVIPSLNNWLEDFVEEIDPTLSMIPLVVDHPLHTNAYWLKFALSNLTQNAFHHGKHPVIIRASDEGGSLCISVEDQGKCEFNSLKVMSQAFIKSRSSHGMGLGLEITRTIIRDWGGTLTYKANPTTFSIVLPQSAKLQIS